MPFRAITAAVATNGDLQIKLKDGDVIEACSLGKLELAEHLRARIVLGLEATEGRPTVDAGLASRVVSSSESESSPYASAACQQRCSCRSSRTARFRQWIVWAPPSRCV